MQFAFQCFVLYLLVLFFTVCTQCSVPQDSHNNGLMAVAFVQVRLADCACAFCLRGREVQSKLRKQDLVFNTDHDDGSTSVSTEQRLYEQDHRGGLAWTSFNYAARITDPIQVSGLKRFSEKLHPDSDRLLQRALCSEVVLNEEV